MNANTQAVCPNVWEGQAIPSTLPPFITVGTQGASTATETLFLDAKGNQAMIRCPLNLVMGKNFIVRVFGRCKTAATITLTIKLYVGAGLASTGFTVGTGNFATSGAVSLASLQGNFDLEAELTFDNDSGTISGRAYGQVVDNMVALVATTQESGFSTITSSLNAYPYADTEVDFGASYTFGTSNAGNYVILDGLELETY